MGPGCFWWKHCCHPGSPKHFKAPFHVSSCITTNMCHACCHFRKLLMLRYLHQNMRVVPNSFLLLTFSVAAKVSVEHCKILLWKENLPFAQFNSTKSCLWKIFWLYIVITTYSPISKLWAFLLSELNYAARAGASCIKFITFGFFFVLPLLTQICRETEN